MVIVCDLFGEIISSSNLGKFAGRIYSEIFRRWQSGVERLLKLAPVYSNQDIDSFTGGIRLEMARCQENYSLRLWDDSAPESSPN